MSRSKRTSATGVSTLALAAALLGGCAPDTRKLDEAAFYDGPRFRLKLTRYFENYPLHYRGEVFRVQCASESTAASPGTKTQDAGWVTLGGGSAIGSRGPEELIERERVNYIVVDNDTVAWIGNGLSVSFNACGSFRSWYPSSLPTVAVIAADKPDYCAPKGRVDCRGHDFMGERAPRFSEIVIAPSGRISFLVRSKAFKDGRAFRVASADAGRTWSATEVEAR